MELRILNVDLSVIVGVVGSFFLEKIFATSGRFEAIPPWALVLRRVWRICGCLWLSFLTSKMSGGHADAGNSGNRNGFPATR
jgi:hypothetical protein